MAIRGLSFPLQHQQEHLVTFAMAESLWEGKYCLLPHVCASCFLPLQYSKHLFVHIGQTNPSYSDPLLEAVDIRQIYDKFPEKKGGLKELYERGPQNSFFLVKFWVRTKQG